MKKIYNWLKKNFFKPEYDIHQLLLNILLISATVGASFAGIMSAILQFDYISVILTAFIVLLGISCLIVANIFQRAELSAGILSILVNNILMPAIFFRSGGLQSGTTLWFTLCLVIPWILLTGKKSYILFAINLCGPLAAIIVGYLYPEWIVPMSNQSDIMIDSIMAFVLVSFVFGSIFKYQGKTYEHQQLKLQESMEQATKATKAKTEFLSNMSHDIRTPMNAIVGFTELAKKNIDDRKRLMDCFSKINISSQHLLNLINDVLDMSIIENGSVQLEEETHSLRSIVNSVTEILKPQVDEKNINLKIDLSEIIEDNICCDQLRLNQILINLLSNAIKFSRNGGFIYFTISQKKETEDGKIIYEFRVKDEGCGMSPEFMEKVFQPFEREKNPKAADTPGSGLGLTITKSLAEMMNGTIEVFSELQKGTEFIITIPFIIPSLTEISENTAEQNYNFTGKRLLLVEDNALNRELETELLTSAGFIIDEARDGTIAIEKVRMAAPGYYAAILMDIQMPILSGYEVTRIIRDFDDKQQALIPIIALSANAFMQDKKTAFEYGMNAFLTKPLILNDLYKVLKIIVEEGERKNPEYN